MGGDASNTIGRLEAMRQTLWGVGGAINTMTFIKITDPKEREALARDLQETKRSIQASDIQRRQDNNVDIQIGA